MTIFASFTHNFIVSSRSFKCSSLDHAKRSLYRAANSICENVHPKYTPGSSFQISKYAAAGYLFIVYLILVNKV